MHDLSKIKSTVAHDPLPFLNALYGDAVRRTGNTWRVGSKDQPRHTQQLTAATAFIRIILK